MRYLEMTDFINVSVLNVTSKKDESSSWFEIFPVRVRSSGIKDTFFRMLEVNNTDEAIIKDSEKARARP
jgi:hypothetical protein